MTEERRQGKARICHRPARELSEIERRKCALKLESATLNTPDRIDFSSMGGQAFRKQERQPTGAGHGYQLSAQSHTNLRVR